MIASEVRNQFLATICVNIISIGYGTVCGWPSAAMLVLKSDKDTPLESGPLTVDQESWVTSLLCVGGFIGNTFFGWFSDKYGRKTVLILAAVIMLISWLLIIFATNPMFLYLARCLAGFSGGGILVAIPIFVSEIADAKVRGTLGSLMVFSCNIGMLLAFILGNYCSYLASPIILIVLPLIFIVAIVFFPETPQYLMKNGNEVQAGKSLRFYRNIKQESVFECTELRSELDKLKLLYLAEEKIVGSSDTSLSLSDFTTPVARKALLIGLCLVALNQFCGCFAMLNYTATIFQEAGSDLTPNMATIVVGAIQLAGAYFPTLLVERAGRKFMLAFSATGTALGLCSLGGYTFLKSTGYSLDGIGWLPVASFSFCIFIASWGVLTLPFMVIAEIMPEKIRGFGTSLCMSCLWVFAFIMIKCFPLLTATFGMHGCMFLFAGFSVAGALFVIIVLPETKGKSFEEIMNLLAK